jgi:transcription elongation factor GreB
VNKAFVKESDQDEDEELAASVPGLPPGSHNYMTRKGYEKLKAELDQLVREERPVLVETIRWAASNGDRSENGDYIYGKKRLREIDRRIRFLLKRLESSTVVAPAEQENIEQVFFGATVTVCDVDGEHEQTYQIVGVDEANASEGRISWIAPLSRALLKAREGDVVRFASPAGMREIEVLEIRYE